MGYLRLIRCKKNKQTKNMQRCGVWSAKKRLQQGGGGGWLHPILLHILLLPLFPVHMSCPVRILKKCDRMSAAHVEPKMAPIIFHMREQRSSYHVGWVQGVEVVKDPKTKETHHKLFLCQCFSYQIHTRDTRSDSKAAIVFFSLPKVLHNGQAASMCVTCPVLFLPCPPRWHAKMQYTFGLDEKVDLGRLLGLPVP